MSSDKEIKIRVILPEYYGIVVQFINEYFYKDEPLCSCEPKIIPNKTDRADILECLKETTSIMAIQEMENGSEELVAVNIGAPKEPFSIEKYFATAEKEGNTKYGQIMKLLGVASRNADVFQRYSVGKVLYSFMSCVKPSARGKNLGKRLKLEIMALAKSLDYKVFTADCTSFYSAGVCESLGMERVHFIAYKDYVDGNNKPIFNPPAPHVGLNSYAIRL